MTRVPSSSIQAFTSHPLGLSTAAARSLRMAGGESGIQKAAVMGCLCKVPGEENSDWSSEERSFYGLERTLAKALRTDRL